MTVLVTGEALIDMLPREGPRGEALRLPVPGGSPFNVALALGRLGVPVRYLCPLSTDAFGDLLAATLRESGVQLDWSRRTPALSTLGFVTLDPTSRSARYAFYTDGTAGSALTVADLPDPLPTEVTAVHVGSFSLAVEPFGTAVETLVRDRVGDRLLAYDPNIRPFLVPDRERLLVRHRVIAARADLIKLSLEDLEWLHPGAAPGSVANAYLDAGASLVVVTRGADGAVGFIRGHHVECPPPPVEVVDTVGAGDTFQASLLTWLAEHQRLSRPGLAGVGPGELRALLEFASAAAALNCTRAGCQPPWRRELP